MASGVHDCHGADVVWFDDVEDLVGELLRQGAAIAAIDERIALWIVFDPPETVLKLAYELEPQTKALSFAPIERGSDIRFRLRPDDYGSLQQRLMMRALTSEQDAPAPGSFR